MHLICFYSVLLLLNPHTIHILQVSSICSSPLLLHRMSISNFTTCMKENVTSTLWTRQCVTITITPCNIDTLNPNHFLPIKSCCLCFYSLPFSFILSLSNCSLPDTFIQSPAEIQLLVTCSSSWKLNNLYVSSVSLIQSEGGKCIRSKHTVRRVSKWEKMGNVYRPALPITSFPQSRVRRDIANSFPQRKSWIFYNPVGSGNVELQTQSLNNDEQEP
jgi:hypothetical protein